MKISGFSFVRNGILLGYPFRESLHSLLPLVDELIVNVPRSDDDTLAAVREIADPRLVVFESDWDESLRSGGRILSLQSNRALERCNGDWAVYLQADELLHEDELEGIRAALHRHLADDRVDGLSFRFLHFEGGHDRVNPFRYRRQVRIVRPGGRVLSSGDACGFECADGSGLRVIRTPYRIFHYGWVRPPAEMLAKNRELEKLYHDDAYLARKYDQAMLESSHELEVCRPFKGSQPAPMRDWFARHGIGPAAVTSHTPYLLRRRVWRRLLKKWGLLR